MVARGGGGEVELEAEEVELVAQCGSVLVRELATLDQPQSQPEVHHGSTHHQTSSLRRRRRRSRFEDREYELHI